MRGKAGDWKFRRELFLFGAVKKSAQFASAPIFAGGEIFQGKIDFVEEFTRASGSHRTKAAWSL